MRRNLTEAAAMSTQHHPDGAQARRPEGFPVKHVCMLFYEEMMPRGAALWLNGHWYGGVQALFEEAIAMAQLAEGNASGAAPSRSLAAAPVCYQWYPYGYILGFLCRRAEYALTSIGATSCPTVLPASHHNQRLLHPLSSVFGTCNQRFAHAGSLSVGASYLQQAGRYFGNSGGAAVLRRYR